MYVAVPIYHSLDSGNWGKAFLVFQLTLLHLVFSRLCHDKLDHRLFQTSKRTPCVKFQILTVYLHPRWPMDSFLNSLKENEKNKDVNFDF